MSKTIEQNAREIIDFKSYLGNMIQEAKLLTAQLGKSITRNLMTGTEQPAQVLLPTEIGGSVQFSVGIVNQFRTHKSNRTGPTIQQTIVQSKKATGPGQSDWEYFPLTSLDSGTDVPRSGNNIHNRTGMNPQGSIVTMIPYSNSANNCGIFESVRVILDLT